MSQFLLLAGNEHTDGLQHSHYALLHSLCTAIQHQQKANQQQLSYGPLLNKQHQFSPNKQHAAIATGSPVIIYNFHTKVNLGN